MHAGMGNTYQLCVCAYSHTSHSPGPHSVCCVWPSGLLAVCAGGQQAWRLMFPCIACRADCTQLLYMQVWSLADRILMGMLLLHSTQCICKRRPAALHSVHSWLLSVRDCLLTIPGRGVSRASHSLSSCCTAAASLHIGAAAFTCRL